MDVINTTGRRKTSVARVYVSEGSGKVVVNNCAIEKYFPLEIQRIRLLDPFAKSGLENKFDAKVKVKGGGITGQLEATRLAISKALCELNGDLKSELKKFGFLTRDPRKVERKKFGRKKARKRFQFTKR